MYLYTQHPLNFHLVKEATDLKLSEFYNDAGYSEEIRKAYDFLYKKLGANNWIWCYGNPVICANKNNKVQNFEQERLWVLDVPEKHIVAIDSTIWDYALNACFYLDCDTYSGVLSAFGNDPEKEKLFDLFLEDVFEKNPYDSYTGIVKPLKKADIFHDQFLIPSPIKKSWVVRTYLMQAERKI